MIWFFKYIYVFQITNFCYMLQIIMIWIFEIYVLTAVQCCNILKLITLQFDVKYSVGIFYSYFERKY